MKVIKVETKSKVEKSFEILKEKLANGAQTLGLATVVHLSFYKETLRA